MILKFVDDNGNTAKVKLTPGGDRNLVIKMMEEKYGFRLVGKSAQHPLKQISRSMLRAAYVNR